MIRSLTGAALCVAVFSSSVAAQDMFFGEPLSIDGSSVYDWSGFYAGAHGSFAAGSYRHSYGPPALLTFDATSPLSGLSGGIQVGGDLQFRQIVIGARALGAISAAAGSEITTIPPPFGPVDFELAPSIKWQVRLDARVGYALGTVLPYLTAGLNVADFQHTTTVFQFVVPTSITRGATALGWSVGAGAEVAFTDRLSGFTEYRFTRFDSIDYGLGSGLVASSESHSVDVGVNYRF